MFVFSQHWIPIDINLIFDQQKEKTFKCQSENKRQNNYLHEYFAFLKYFKLI